MSCSIHKSEVTRTRLCPRWMTCFRKIHVGGFRGAFKRSKYVGFPGLPPLYPISLCHFRSETRATKMTDFALRTAFSIPRCFATQCVKIWFRYIPYWNEPFFNRFSRCSDFFFFWWKKICNSKSNSKSNSNSNSMSNSRFQDSRKI